jgi:hypothetical protein
VPPSTRSAGRPFSTVTLATALLLAAGTSWAVADEVAAGASDAEVLAASTAPDALPPTTAEALLEDNALPATQAVNFQRAVAACMSSKGFSYFLAMDASATETPQETPTETDGYNVVDSLSPAATAADEAVYERRVDRNEDYYAGLSAEQRTAYRVALTGSDVEDGFEPTAKDEMTQGFEMAPEDNDAGCSGAAHEVVTEPAREALGELAAAASDDLLTPIENDPTVVAAEEAWAACMGEHGHPVDSPDEPAAELAETAEELTESGADSAEWQELAQEEQAVAEADLGCRETSGLDSAQQELIDELLPRFIDEQRDLLEQAAGVADAS